MQNNTTHINLPTTGIISDQALLTLDSDKYSFALNAINADLTGEEDFLQNEMSNVCAVKFPLGYKVVGFKHIPEQERTIYMLVNPTSGNCQIGEVKNCANFPGRTDKLERVYCKNCPEYQNAELLPLEQQKEKCYCTYRVITQSTCLGFNINYPIDIEYRLTSCSLNIYFTDGINERRFVYFDYANNDITDDLLLQDIFKTQTGVTGACDTPVYNDVVDCEKIKVHPKYDRVCIDFLGFVNGGNLQAGTYQVLIAYSDAYGNVMSNYFPSTQTIPLFKKSITFETNYTTGSALSFKILNLKNNTLYNHYNIVIAENIDGFTQLKYIGTFPTTQTEYVYTGFETDVRVLNPQDVFFRYPYYKTATSVTKANNYLFYSNVKSYKKLNLQPVANAIKLYWQTVALKEGAYKDPKNTFLFRSEQRDEVVPYGIVFELDNGQETCAFHIPGREAIPDDLISIATNNNDYISDKNCITNAAKPKWKIYNTATVTGTPHEYNQDCEYNKCWEYGEFAYWESTEKYPNIPEIWGTLCNQPIRHHKFPDSCVSHIHDGVNTTKPFTESNYIFPIGVQIDHNSVITAIANAVTNNVITQEDANRIVSYRIVRGNRLGQKSIIAKGLFYNMWNYDKFGNTYYYPNYAYNDLTQDVFLSPTNNFNGSNTSNPNPTPTSKIDFSRFTFHSPDTHFVNPDLGSFVKIETEEYGESEGYFTHSDCQAKHKLLSTAARVLAFGLGLAAAIFATSKQECRTVTYKSDYLSDQDNSDTTTQGNGTMAVPSISGTVPGSIFTIIQQRNFRQANTTTTNPTITETHNNQQAKIYDDCGNEILEVDSNNDPVKSESYTKNFCTAKQWQIFNCNVGIGGIIGTIIGGLPGVIQRTMLGIIEMNKVIDTLRTLIPYKNYSIQYNSVGKYNNYKCVLPNNKNREILRSAYLEPIIQSIEETSTTPNNTATTIRVNNWNRESSVYLKLGGTNLVAPTVVDNSRVTMDDQFSYKNAAGRYASLNENFRRTISSYYGAIKRNIPNQYGDICSIDYLETGNCSFFLNKTYTTCEAKVFGGDTFINRFSIKRKMPFWLQTRCGLPDGSDVKYSELSNVAFPNFYFNVEEPLAEKLDNLGFGMLTILQDLIGAADSRMDAKTSKFFYQNGYIHMYNYGVPSFIVESDINLDYRHGQPEDKNDFFPHQTDLKYWFEEKNVPISTDNKYFYNRSYSKQNKETPICKTCVKNYKDFLCTNEDDNLTIYSEQNEQERKNDNWLVFKANNRYNFPLTLGKLISVDGIENDKVLVRLENATQLFNAYNTIQATPENIQVGTGGIFANRPQEFATTDLGYAGSQHRSIVHTEFGHIWADAKRGSIISVNTGGNGMDDLTKYGVKHWFKENLPFQIKKDFPTIESQDLDNNLKGIGLHLCFDKRFNRLLVTKLDYKKIDSSVQYNKVTKTFYILNNLNQQVPVNLNNPRYFCNKSWTRSFDFAKKLWRSFHTYTPNFYVEHIDGFESSNVSLVNVSNVITEQQSTYLHHATNKSYQVFYGKLQPFIIELIGKQSLENNFIDSLEYKVDAIRYHNSYDYYLNNTATFNKAIIYNDRQCSGLINLVYNDHNNMALIGQYPKLDDNGLHTLITNRENIWSFNNFFDMASSQHNNLPLFINDCANVNKTLNPKAINYFKPDFSRGRIRQNMCRIRLIQDKTSNYKFVFNYLKTNQNKSYR